MTFNKTNPGRYVATLGDFRCTLYKERGTWSWLVEGPMGLLAWGGNWATRADCESEFAEKFSRLIQAEAAACT